MCDDPLAWTTRRLAGYKAPRTVNPRPPGTIRIGGTTDAVLQFLCHRPDHHWVSNRQIVAGVLKPGRRESTIRWALTCLRALGMVEDTTDFRHARYLKYRVTPYGMTLKR